MTDTPVDPRDPVVEPPARVEVTIGAPRSPRLWRPHRSSVRESHTVIAKLRASSEPVLRMSRALRASRNEEVGVTRLSSLVENGYAQHIEPVFETTTPPEMVRRGMRYLAAGIERQPDLNHARGLVEIAVEPGVNAEDLCQHVEASGEVEYAYVPAVRHIFGKRSSRRPDPLASRQWGHGAVRIAHARLLKSFKEATAITVAVVDSGIDPSHPDLQGVISEYRNFVTRENDRDVIGHGTHVAGIIAAGMQNGVGIAGLCAAKILALKALPGNDDNWSATAYYRALRYCIGKAKVLNLSLGGEKDQGEIDVLRDVIDSGVVVVAAMGNEFEEGNPIEYPAAMADVCAVGATDQLDRRASFSNTGKHIDLSAPGVEILSTTPTHPIRDGRRNYDSWDGTSMATPHVAAAAALVFARAPKSTPLQVVRRLKSTADRVHAMKAKRDSEFGSGRLNCEAALR